MKRFIQKYANSKSILLLLGILLLFNLVILPSVLSAGQSPIDLLIPSSPTKIYELLGTYDEATKKAYIIAELTLDLIYPIVYSLFFSFILFLTYKNHKIALFPFLVLIADYLENLGIVVLLHNYSSELAWATSIFSNLKWALLFTTVILVIFGLARKVIRKISS